MYMWQVMSYALMILPVSILRAAMVLGKAMDLSPLRLRQPYNAR